MKTKTRTYQLLTALTAIALLGACAGQAGDTGSTADPDGTEWMLTSLDGVDLIPDSQITLIFADGRAAGTAGCNSYGTEYTVDGSGSISLGLVASTLMACMEPEGLMDQETEYLGLLGSVTSYDLAGDGSQLELKTDDGLVLTFVPLVHEAPPSLEGTSWRLVTFVEGNMETAPLEGTETTLTFEGSDVGGSAGCNTYGGSYTIDGDTLTFGMLFNTEMACMNPEGLMEQEQLYLSILGATATYSGDETTLQLSTADGRGLGFVAQE